jgi:hypothetical protein
MSHLGNNRPDCKECSMQMISFDGPNKEHDKKTFELRCGHIERQKVPARSENLMTRGPNIEFDGFRTPALVVCSYRRDTLASILFPQDHDNGAPS